MPGGVAALDYNNDIYFTNGAELPSLRTSSPEYRNRLFRSVAAVWLEYDHDGRFDCCIASQASWNRSVWLDYDYDGRFDLFVVNYVKWRPGIDPVCGRTRPRQEGLSRKYSE